MFSIVVDTPRNAELYELGRVVNRAYSAGYTDATTYVDNTMDDQVKILEKQVNVLDHVFFMSEEHVTPIHQSAKVTSTLLRTKGDPTGQALLDAAEHFRHTEFLVVVAADVNNVGDVVSLAMKYSIVAKKNIYVISNDISRWESSPNYSDLVMRVASRHSVNAKRLIGIDDGDEGAYEVVKNLVMPKTIERWNDGKG